MEQSLSSHLSFQLQAVTLEETDGHSLWNTWLWGWCNHQNIGDLDRGIAYIAPGIRWDSLFSKQEECLHSGASGAQWELDLKRQRNNARLACHKLWDETSKLERWGPSEGPQLVTLRHPGYTSNLNNAVGMPEGWDVSRGTWTRIGPMGNSWGSTKPSTKCYTLIRATTTNNTGWGMNRLRVALPRRTWACWWMRPWI